MRDATDMGTESKLPERARVVIIGGGIVGTSVAYHLTRMGWTDVVLLEQGQLSSGTTWHAAGLLGQLRATEGGTRLVQYSAQLYSELERETGLATGFKRCGGVTVARTEERMVQLRRTAATAEAYDLECELITPERAKELYPVLAIDDLVGAIWLPGDGTANPVDVTASLARGARDKGARVFERTRAVGIDQERGQVTGVVTDQGRIGADVVVNCAGQWAKAVGVLAGVNVPLHSAEHFYVVSEQIEGVLDPPPHHIRRQAEIFHRIGELVLDDIGHEACGWILANHADHVSELARREFTSRPPIDQDLAREPSPGEVRHEAVDCAQQRRLSRTRGTDHHAELSLADGKVDPIESGGSGSDVGKRHINEADHATTSARGVGPRPIVASASCAHGPTGSTGATHAGSNPITMPTTARTGSVGGPSG